MASLSDGSAVALSRSCVAVIDTYMRMRRRTEGPRLETRAVAVLVWFLSSRPLLAVVYLQQRSLNNYDVTRDMATHELAALSLLDWFRNGRVRNLVMAAIESLNHPIRYRADVFLMHTCLVGLIVDHNNRGLTVDLPEAVQLYLRLWSHRPMSDRSAEVLRRLVWHRNSRRRFGVQLRLNFMLVLTALPRARELSREDQLTRVISRYCILGPSFFKLRLFPESRRICFDYVALCFLSLCSCAHMS